MSPPDTTDQVKPTWYTKAGLLPVDAYQEGAIQACEECIAGTLSTRDGTFIPLARGTDHTQERCAEDGEPVAWCIPMPQLVDIGDGDELEEGVELANVNIDIALRRAALGSPLTSDEEEYFDHSCTLLAAIPLAQAGLEVETIQAMFDRDHTWIVTRDEDHLSVVAKFDEDEDTEVE